jgi:hypothetical protein
VARPSESRWLWLGGGFIAVAVALLGVAATFDTASKVPYSYGTSLPVIVAYILFGLSLVCFGCANREVPFPYPISRRDTGLLGHPVRSGPTEPSATSVTSSSDVTGASSGAGDPPIASGSPDAPNQVGESAQVVVGDLLREPAAFQDRPEILGTLMHPEPDPGTGVVFAVTGPRGAGKSQLAAACARRRLDAWWRVVAWLNAEDREQLLGGFAELATALGLSDGPDDSATSATLVRRWLQADGTRCLLVLDNATNADLIRPFLPAAGQAHVIITSSHPTITSLGIPIPVEAFTPDQATAYLTERTGRGDHPGVGEVGEELGYLPLALAQAAAVIAGQRLDYSTYLRRLAEIPVADYLTRSEGDPYPRDR